MLSSIISLQKASGSFSLLIIYKAFILKYPTESVVCCQYGISTEVTSCVSGSVIVGSAQVSKVSCWQENSHFFVARYFSMESYFSIESEFAVSCHSWCNLLNLIRLETLIYPRQSANRSTFFFFKEEVYPKFGMQIQ